MPKQEPPIEKFKNEIKSVFLRWWEESDLDEKDMGYAIIEVTEEFCETSVEFEADFEIEDDDE